MELELVKGSFSRANLDNGFIILTHDVYEQTTTTLTTSLIEYIKDEGFKFCTVAECKFEFLQKYTLYDINIIN